MSGGSPKYTTYEPGTTYTPRDVDSNYSSTVGTNLNYSEAEEEEGREAEYDAFSNFSQSTSEYDIYDKQTDIEDGDDKWFLAGGSNNPLTATDDIEAQEALSQGGSTDVLISNPHVDSSKTYSLSEAMGTVDTSGATNDKTEDYFVNYTGSDLYYGVTGKNKSGSDSGGSYSLAKAGKNDTESASASRAEAYTMAAQDRWLQEVNAGNNADYYIDANNKIRARKNQVTLTGYDGGVIGVQNSGVR